MRIKNGNGDRVQVFATITHLMLALGAVVLACGVAYATLVSRVNAMEGRMPGLEKDHDLLISINANVDNMRKDVALFSLKLEAHIGEKK